MLLAVMILLAGIPNSPVLSTNVSHLGPSLVQTSNDTACTETWRLAHPSLEQTSNSSANIKNSRFSNLRPSLEQTFNSTASTETSSVTHRPLLEETSTQTSMFAYRRPSLERNSNSTANIEASRFAHLRPSLEQTSNSTANTEISRLTHLRPVLAETLNGTASTETSIFAHLRPSLEQTSSITASTETSRFKQLRPSLEQSSNSTENTETFMLAHLSPYVEQTSNGPASTETSILKPTSKDIVPLTLLPGTMLTNSPLKSLTLHINSPIPDHTLQYRPQSLSSASLIDSSINHFDRTVSDSTIPSIAETPLFATTRTTEDQRSTTESPRKASVEAPVTTSQERRLDNDGSPNSISEFARTKLRYRTTNPVPTRWSGEKAPYIPTSMTYSLGMTSLSESTPTVKPNPFRRGFPILTHRKQTTLHPLMKSTFVPPTSATGPQSTTPLKARIFTTNNLTLALSKSPVPSEPLSSQNQQYADMLGNTVKPMRYLPWSSQESTSVSFENEFGNVIRPTLPSVFPRKATISLKNGRYDDVKKAATPSLAMLQKPQVTNSDYYQYGASSTLPALNLLGNKSLLHPTSSPMTGALEVSQPMPSLPIKVSAESQSLLRGIFSSRDASSFTKLSSDAPPPLVLTRDGNRRMPHLKFPLGGSSPGSRKHPYVVPPPQMQTKNQSVLPPSAQLPQAVPSFRRTSTEGLPPEILPTVPEMDNVIVNLTQNCSNDYCVSDEDYIDMMLAYMFPSDYEWVLIGMHIIVFIGGLVGNALVCLAVYRNHSMRTVTNYFIVNLAAADFLVILLCLPPSVLWDVTETWFMGTALCKIVLYFQTVSVAVSVLTLTFISIDRWYAICCPLKFKSTTGRAKKAIVVIWVLALAFDIPEMVVLQTKRKELNIDTNFFTQCEASWSDKTDMIFHCLQTVLLYTVPLVFMSIAYYQIVKVLWSSDNIPGHKERFNSSCNNTQTTSCRSDTIARKMMFKRSISNTVSTSGQVISRRKAAKMLVAVVIMFAVCYCPVHILSILRYIYDIPQTDATTAFSMVSHWLCYANSAVNPLIYNFMSGKFRKEFANTFGCRRFSWKRPTDLMKRRRRRQVVASLGDRAVQPTEMAPLSRDRASNVAVDLENGC